MSNIDLNFNTLKPGLRREDINSLKNNNDEKVLFIFDLVDTNTDGIISEEEVNNYNNASNTINLKSVNPKMQDKVDKLQLRLSSIHSKLVSEEKELIELENYYRVLEDSDENIGSKEKDNIIKLIEKKNGSIKKLYEKIDKYYAQLVFLTEVKIDDNLSNKDITQNAQLYMMQRNQMNPYYSKYKELQMKYDMETDDKKRSELWQQYSFVDELVHNWKPEKINFQLNQLSPNLNLSTDIKTNTDETTEAFNVGFNTKLKNHTLNANSNLTFTQDTTLQNQTHNIMVGLSDNIEIGENSNLTISSNYTNYSSNNNEGVSNNNTIATNINATTQIGNISLNANYQNQYSKTSFANENFSNVGSSINNSGGLSFNNQIKKINYGTGLNISNSLSNDNSQTLYSIPINLSYNAISNEKNTFVVNGNYTSTLGKNYSSSSYTANLNYNYNSSKINLNNSTYFNYTKGNFSGESFNYNNTTSLTNKKYGYNASIVFTGSNSKYQDMYDINTSFSTPMNQISKLKVGAGYNSQTGAYGTLGIAFNIDMRDKKNKTN